MIKEMIRIKVVDQMEIQLKVANHKISAVKMLWTFENYTRLACSLMRWQAVLMISI